MHQPQTTLAQTIGLSTALMLSIGLDAKAAAAPQGNEANEAIAAAKATVAGATSDFGFDLYRRFAAKSNGGNLFFSPLSLSTALTMAAEGARGDTGIEMIAALRLADAGLGKAHFGHSHLRSQLEGGADDPEQRRLSDRIRQLKAKLVPFRKRIRDLEKQKKWREMREASNEERDIVSQLNRCLRQLKGHRLSVANALYCDQSYPLSASYVSTLQASYDTGAVVPADFRNNAAAAISSINNWVRECTEQRIKQLVGPNNIDDQTRLVLLNAVHFQGRWMKPFSARGTQARPFHLGDGTKSDTKIMRTTFEGCRYGAFTAAGQFFTTPRMVNVTPGQATEQTYPDGGFHVVEMPYRGGELSMVVLAPIDANGLPVIESMLSSERVNDWVGKLAQRETVVSLPKFESDSAYDVGQSLKDLGMQAAFDRQRADFSGMTSSKSRTDGLYISSVVHKAFISVDEKGTEAAAATAILMGPTSAAPGGRVPFTPHFNADRPFVYMIRDVRTGAVLFLGRYSRP